MLTVCAKTSPGHRGQAHRPLPRRPAVSRRDAWQADRQARRAGVGDRRDHPRRRGASRRPPPGRVRRAGSRRWGASCSEIRVMTGALLVGLGRAAYDAALRYSKERVTFGFHFGEHQAVTFRLVDMLTQLHAARTARLPRGVVHRPGAPGHPGGRDDQALRLRGREPDLRRGLPESSRPTPSQRSTPSSATSATRASCCGAGDARDPESDHRPRPRPRRASDDRHRALRFAAPAVAVARAAP